MAYNARHINPIDLKPSTAVGVSLPFSAPQAFLSTYTTQDQLRYNIINLLLTDRRERVFVPNFGAGIASQVFEQITPETLATLESIVKSSVENQFPNVAVTKVLATPTYDENAVNVQVQYSITNTGQTDQITLNLENG
jgi:phage baseplate assembly protein W